MFSNSGGKDKYNLYKLYKCQMLLKWVNFISITTGTPLIKYSEEYAGKTVYWAKIFKKVLRCSKCYLCYMK